MSQFSPLTKYDPNVLRIIHDPGSRELFVINYIAKFFMRPPFVDLDITDYCAVHIYIDRPEDSEDVYITYQLMAAGGKRWPEDYSIRFYCNEHVNPHVPPNHHYKLVDIHRAISAPARVLMMPELNLDWD